MELLHKQTLRQFVLNENIQITVISLLSFTIPFLLKQPQIMIGSVVNFILIYSISHYSLKKIFPVLFLPSIATLLNGVLFGSFTIYLVYLIPFIIISNLIYVMAYKYVKIGYLNVITASLLKACFLFSCAYILFNTVHIPEIFLTTMGAIQLYTALIGGVLAQTLIIFKNKK